MAVTINKPVHFYYVATGDTIPSNKDNNTIYFIEETQEIYVGNVLIANVSILPNNILTTDQGVLTQDQITNVKNKLNIQNIGPTWTTNSN